MRKLMLPAALVALGLASPIPAGAVPFAGSAVQAAVLDGAQTAAPGAPQGARIIPVYGGCGPFGHRGPYGGCRSGGQWGGYIPGRACPPGWHIGPYGRRCWRNW